MTTFEHHLRFTLALALEFETVASGLVPAHKPAHKGLNYVI